jgi:hypothetical protein
MELHLGLLIFSVHLVSRIIKWMCHVNLISILDLLCSFVYYITIHGMWCTLHF